MPHNAVTNTDTHNPTNTKSNVLKAADLFRLNIDHPRTYALFYLCWMDPYSPGARQLEEVPGRNSELGSWWGGQWETQNRAPHKKRHLQAQAETRKWEERGARKADSRKSWKWNLSKSGLCLRSSNCLWNMLFIHLSFILLVWAPLWVYLCYKAQTSYHGHPHRPSPQVSHIQCKQVPFWLITNISWSAGHQSRPL